MSYCRFSSDNWRSDVYVYADVGGYWQIWIAGNRTVEDVPLVPEIPSSRNREAIEDWVEARERQHLWLNTAPRIKISLPHAGDGFQESTPGECADRLAYLKDLGYRIPDGVIESLREEEEETKIG